MDFTTATPAEIDGAWNEASVALRTAASRLASSVISRNERWAASTRKGFNIARLTVPLDDLLARHDEQYAIAAAYEAEWATFAESGYDEALRPERPSIPHREGGFAETKHIVGYDADYAAQIREAQATIAAADAEFTRRGGWSRAYLVTSSAKGHVHRNWCGSWRWTTQVGLVTELSGADEAAIVDYAGANACTRCFKSAPVA